MLKRNSIIKFILLAIIAILGILLCVCPFSVPYSADVYNGIIPAINKGLDLNGGISAVYECSIPNGDEEGLTDSVDKSLSKIQTMFEKEKFSQLQVSRQGGSKIYVISSGEYANEFNDSYYYMAEGKDLFFTAVSVSDETPNPDVYARSSVVSKSYVDYDNENQKYGITIEFTKKGVEELKELKKHSTSLNSNSVYLYLGELTTESKLAEVNVSDLGKDSIFITLDASGKYSASSSQNGQKEREVSYYILSGSLDVELELLDVCEISPILGQNTKLYLSIALAVIVVATFVCLILRYRHLGLIASLGLTFYLILFSFFMMTLPFVTLDLAGVIGSIGAFLISVLAIVFIFEKIKEEYAMGKKIHLSCKGGFKRALWTILDSHFIIIFISVFTWIFAPAMLKGFGIAMILGSLLSMFISLVVMRLLVKDYLRINSTKANKLGLYRDKNVKEVKDEDVEIIKENVATEVVEGGSHE